MNLLAAAAVAVLFGAGVHLILRRNLIEVVAGAALLSNASFVFIVAAGFAGYDPPILPLRPGDHPADPLVQAMALTAMVISFGMTAFLLALVLRYHRHHDSLNQSERGARNKGRHRRPAEGRPSIP